MKKKGFTTKFTKKYKKAQRLSGLCALCPFCVLCGESQLLDLPDRDHDDHRFIRAADIGGADDGRLSLTQVQRGIDTYILICGLAGTELDRYLNPKSEIVDLHGYILRQLYILEDAIVESRSIGIVGHPARSRKE